MIKCLGPAEKPPGPAGPCYSMPLRERLPIIAIPLRGDALDVPLDIQALVDQVWVNGRYAMSGLYERPCVPPLEGEDAAWAEELLKAAKRGESQPER